MNLEQCLWIPWQPLLITKWAATMPEAVKFKVLRRSGRLHTSYFLSDRGRTLQPAWKTLVIAFKL